MNHGFRPSSVEPNGTAVTQSANVMPSSGTLDYMYAPQPSYDGSGAPADHLTGVTRSTCIPPSSTEQASHELSNTSHVLCSASASSTLAPPPSYEEDMSICSASRASSHAPSMRRKSSKMSYNQRISSLKTASTTTMISFNDDDDNNACAEEAAALDHARHDEVFPHSSSASYRQDKEPIYFTGHLNDRRLNSDQSLSSSRDASPIARRRPHNDSLVATAHSLASADSVRAELERIQNIGRDVPSVASLSSRCTAKPSDNADHDNKFRGYSNRRQSSSRFISGSASVGGLSSGVGVGGSVSSLSHLTSISRGSFSSIPRMILKDDNAKDDVSYDPLSYNFVDSDSEVDADDLEDALHTIRMEQFKIDVLKANLGELEQDILFPPLPPSNCEAKKTWSKYTHTTSHEDFHPNDSGASPSVSHLDSSLQYRLAMGPRQEPAKLSPHPSIGSSTSDNRSKSSLERSDHQATLPPTAVEGEIRKGSDVSNEDTNDLRRLPLRKEGSWTTALGA